jgi:hypothetical protein
MSNPQKNNKFKTNSARSMALCGIVPPGTLSVVPSVGTNETTMTVPTLTFNPVTIEPLSNNLLLDTLTTFRDSNNRITAQITLLKPAPPLQRLASVVAQSASHVNIPSIEPNATFDLQFTGPGLQCETATGNQLALINQYADRMSKEVKAVLTTDITLTERNNSNPPIVPKYLEYFSAFSPQLYPWFKDTAVNGSFGLVREDGNFLVPNTTYADNAIDYGVELWVQLANYSVVCSVTNASYDIGFNYTNGVPLLTHNKITHLAKITNVTADSTKYFNNYHAWAAALWSTVYGNATAFSETCNITQPDSTNKTGYCYSIDEVSSKVVLTGLKDCDDFQHSWWEENADLFGPHKTPSQPFANDFTNQCRNKTIPRALEDMAANLTISMLSFAQ